jgi:hypothetical protein
MPEVVVISALESPIICNTQEDRIVVATPRVSGIETASETIVIAEGSPEIVKIAAAEIDIILDPTTVVIAVGGSGSGGGGSSDHFDLINIGVNTHVEIDDHIAAEEELKASRSEPTGFPNRTDSTLSFDDLSRTFTIAPAVDEFDIFIDGEKTTFDTSQSVAITDTEGLWFIYFDSAGVLTSSQVAWTFGSSLVFVAIAYWDATNKTAILLGEERHGHVMSWAEHKYLHYEKGAQWISGFTPALSVDGDGSLDVHCEMQSISAGTFFDEDIDHTPVEQSTYEMWYKDGASANWRREAASAALVSITGSRPDYNEFTGGAWQRTEVGNNRFTLTHIFATNRPDGTTNTILVMGEGAYISKSVAQDAATTEIANLTAGELPTPEFVAIATVIVGVKSSYGNSYDAIIISTEDGNDFVDWRENERQGVGGSNNHHGNLSGLGENDHPQYLLAGVGYTGEMRDSTYTKIADVVDGLIVSVEFPAPPAALPPPIKEFKPADGLSAIIY